MKSSVIRKANTDDLPQLNIISVATKMHWKYPAEWLEHWKDALAVTPQDLVNQQVYVLQTDHSMVGFCAIAETEPHYEITHMWIIPRYIGKGDGKLLLNETLRRVATTTKPVIVEADPHAESFYQHLGFHTFNQRESCPSGRFLPLMKKELGTG